MPSNKSRKPGAWNHRFYLSFLIKTCNSCKRGCNQVATRKLTDEEKTTTSICRWPSSQDLGLKTLMLTEDTDNILPWSTQSILFPDHGQHCSFGLYTSQMNKTMRPKPCISLFHVWNLISPGKEFCKLSIMNLIFLMTNLKPRKLK